MATAAAAIRPSRPSIFIAGVEETGLAQGLTRLRIRESAQGLYHFEAAFGNWGPKSGAIDFLYFDRKKLDFGKAIEIRIDRDVLFAGRITALEAEFAEGRPPQITVLAEDRLQDLRMTRRTRTFNNVSDADVFRTIAGNHSLQTEIDITGPTHKVLVQVNESDLSFLRGRARLAGVELWVEGTKLFVKTRAARGSRTLTLNYGGDLRTFTVLADLAHQRTKCTVSGWDVAGKEALKSDATDSILGREIENQDSGASILRKALGERNENVSHLVSTTSAETDAQAESVFRAFARRFVTGRGTAQPNGLIRTGAVLDLKNLGPLFSGKYNVTSVEHTFDSASGFLTGFEVERAGLGRAR